MWLDQIHSDPEMVGAASNVMYAITRRLDRETFTCTAGNIHLAQLAHVTDRTVKSAIRKARERGHIETDRPSRRDAAHIRPVLKGDPERGQYFTTGRGNEWGNEWGKPFRGSPVESKGCAPISHISHISHKYKKEEDLKNGNSRGPKAPEKESKPSSTDSPKPSSPRSTCDVPRPPANGGGARFVAFDSPAMALVERWEMGLPPIKRLLRGKSGGCWLTEAEYAAVNGGGLTGGSS